LQEAAAGASLAPRRGFPAIGVSRSAAGLTQSASHQDEPHLSSLRSPARRASARPGWGKSSPSMGWRTSSRSAA